MAISDITDSISTDPWWKNNPTRMAAFFVALDASGNVIDSGLCTNTVLGTDVNAKQIVAAAKTAVRALNF